MELLHGGNVYDKNLTKWKEAGGKILDFSANINPLGMPEGVRRAVLENLTKAEYYPDPLCRKLKAALSEYYHLPEEFFICGNGGADLIYRFVYALRPKRALLTAPTFAEYEEALRQTETELLFYQLPDFVVGNDILEQMDSQIDVMFLCNPNNPTGLFIDPNLMLRILEKAEQQGIFLFVDECFLDLTGCEERHSLVKFARTYQHLWILKSFTKMYAMPGIRLGYGISQNQELLVRMGAAGQCWGVNVLASEAGVAALKEADYRQQAIILLREERKFLKTELENLGFQVLDGQANYLFFQAPGITNLFDRLLPFGILIRRCANYRGLDATCYRVAVKSHEDNLKLIDALKEVL